MKIIKVKTILLKILFQVIKDTLKVYMLKIFMGRLIKKLKT